MTSQDLRPDDRETLSALFDGELGGEARLFALRRLGHDEEWRDTTGRWQLIGDALRRQAPVAAPADFAGRVATAVSIATPAPVPAAVAKVAPRGRRVRWIGGGALAASIALAVVVASLPSGPEPQAVAPVVASTSPATAPRVEAPPTIVAETPAPAPQAAVVASAPASSAPVAVTGRSIPDAAPAIAAAPQRRVASQLRAPRESRTVAVSDRTGAVPPIAEAALQAGASGNPFNLSSDETLTARPWPRASLGTPAGAFTARYGAAGDSTGERPSFYPFEPRLQGEAEQVPSP